MITLNVLTHLFANLFLSVHVLRQGVRNCWYCL